MRNHKTRKRLARLANRMNGGFGARLIGNFEFPKRIEIGTAVWHRGSVGTYYCPGYTRDITALEGDAIERAMSDRHYVVAVVFPQDGEFQLMRFDR